MGPGWFLLVRQGKRNWRPLTSFKQPVCIVHIANFVDWEVSQPVAVIMMVSYSRDDGRHCVLYIHYQCICICVFVFVFVFLY